MTQLKITAGELEPKWMGGTWIHLPQDLPDWVKGLVPELDRTAMVGAAGVYLGTFKELKRTVVAWFQHGKRTDVSAESLGSLVKLAMRPDGERALAVGFLRNQVIEISPDGACRIVLEESGLGTRDVAYVRDGFAISTESGIRFYASVGATTARATMPIKDASGMKVVLGGKALVVESANAIHVIDARGESFEQLASVKCEDPAGFFEHDGTVYFRGSDDNGYRPLEGLAERLAS
jgi:hypothetical protein